LKLKHKVNRVTVEQLTEALGKDPRQVIIDLLNETQSVTVTVERLKQMSNLPIDRNRLNYLRMRLRIDEKAKTVITRN
jgi:hypothetical protein